MTFPMYGSDHPITAPRRAVIIQLGSFISHAERPPSPGAGSIGDPVDGGRSVLYFPNSFIAFISFMPALQESSLPSYSHLYRPWRLEGIGSRLSQTRTTFLS